MKLIAKKGTAFEQILKQMYDKIIQGIIDASDLVEKTVGVRPTGIYHLYHWGTLWKLTPEFVFDDKDVERIDPKYLRKKSKTNDVWIPSIRYKEGKSLYTAFREFARANEITDQPLNELGIRTVDWEKGVSWGVQLSHDKKNDRYLLICSDSIPKGFDNEKLVKDQFEIEY